MAVVVNGDTFKVIEIHAKHTYIAINVLGSGLDVMDVINRLRAIDSKATANLRECNVHEYNMCIYQTGMHRVVNPNTYNEIMQVLTA